MQTPLGHSNSPYAPVSGHAGTLPGCRLLLAPGDRRVLPTPPLNAIGLRVGDTVLIGGAGVFAVQLAKLAGATLIGTGSEGTFELLRELGTEPVAYGAGSPTGCAWSRRRRDRSHRAGRHGDDRGRAGARRPPERIKPVVLLPGAYEPKRAWMTDPSELRSQITPELPALSTASCAYAPSAVNLSRLPKVPLVAVTCRP